MARPLRLFLLAALLAIATAASYAPVLSAGFVDIDDADYVPENEQVLAGLRGEGVAWAFGGAHAGNWIPLAWLSHMADVEIFGTAPRGHHAMNLALHVANALLLFGVLAAATRAVAPSFAVAALFALHPVNVEAVAWISQRKTTLSTGFALLAIAGYGRWARAGSRAAYGASLACFAASLLAKQTFVTLPFALLLLDAWPLRRDAAGWRRLVAEKLPYLALALGASAAAVLAQGDAIATGSTYPLEVRLGNAVLSVVRYLGLLGWPTRLAVFYPLYEDDVTAARVAGACALLLAATAAALWFGRTHRAIAVGWLWFLGSLVPVIGLVQIGAQAMADRYAYAAQWGLAIALVWTVWEAWRTRVWLRPVAAAALAAACTALALLTHEQAGHWRDSVALFEDAIADTERNYVAHRALAGQWFERGEYAQALRHAEEGARHPRDLGDVLPVYGMALYQTGAKAEAIAKLEAATRAAPRSAVAFANLGWVLLQEGDAARARDALETAVALDPERSATLYLLAVAALRVGRTADAADTLARVVTLDPLHFDAWTLRAQTLARLGRFAEAGAALDDAITAAARFPEDRRAQLVSTLHQYRGDVLVAQGDAAGAVAAYERALGTWAGNAAARTALERARAAP